MDRGSNAAGLSTGSYIWDRVSRAFRSTEAYIVVGDSAESPAPRMSDPPPHPQSRILMLAVLSVGEEHYSTEIFATTPEFWRTSASGRVEAVGYIYQLTVRREADGWRATLLSRGIVP